MQDSRDVIWIAAIDGKARISAGQHFLDAVFHRFIQVQQGDLGPVGHNIRNLDIIQFQDGSQHRALMGNVRILTIVQIDGTAQLFLMLFFADRRGNLHTERLQGRADDGLNRMGYRREHDHDHADYRRNLQGDGIGMAECIGLRQNLREDQHQQRHDNGRIGNARLAEQTNQQGRRQRGGQDIDQIVSQQDRADQPVLLFQQRDDDGGTPVALLRLQMHTRARRGGQRRFRPRKEKGQDQKAQNRADGHQFGFGHAAIASCSSALRSSSRTSWVIKASPIPRSRMKVRRPSFTFLSLPMR